MLRLRKKPIVQAALKTPLSFTLLPTPFSSNKNLIGEKDHRRAVDLKGLQIFAAWMLQHFKGNAVSRTQLAEALDVHRIVVNEWLFGLSLHGLIRLDCIHNDRGDVERYVPTNTFYIEQLFSDKDIILVKDKTSAYDPWIDRSWDKYFINVWQPYFIDEIVDKYYSVFIDEDYILTGQRRHKDGYVFYPLADKRNTNDHPLYFKNSVKKKTYSKKTKRPNPPPFARKKEIQALCYQPMRGIRKRGETTTQNAFKSHLSAHYYSDTTTKRNTDKTTDAGTITKLRLRKRA